MQFVKICAPPFDKKSRRTFMVGLWICAGSTSRDTKCGIFFYKRAAIRGRKAAIWWEESGTHAAMFSSAAAECLLHSF